jgi:RNA polymerase sigma-70 factor (ECF subfamily)
MSVCSRKLTGSKNDRTELQVNEIQTHLLAHLHVFVGFARKRLGDADLGADAVQESLLKAIRAKDQIRDEERAKAWFYRILRRTIIDLYRRRDARDRAIENLQREVDGPLGDDEDRLVCACMDRLIATLTPQYAALIRRLDLNLEDPASVAASLGISKNNLNVRSHRARQQLKQRLEETCRVCAQHGCLDCHCSKPEHSA